MATTANRFWETQLSKAMFNSINVWVNVCDTELNILVWNPTAERISGYMADEVVGNDLIWDWLYPDQKYKEQIQGLSNTLFESDRALTHITTEILCRDATLKHIAWYSRPLLDASNEIRGLVTFGYDVTDQKRSEEALQKANNELQILYQIASITSEYTDLSQIFENCLLHIHTITSCGVAGIYLWNAPQHRLDLVDSRGDAGELPHEIPLAASELDKESLLEIDLVDLPRFISMPMFAKGKLQGSIGILVKPNQNIPPDQLNLLRSIADQIAIAIDNANLYQRAKKLAISEERRRLARDLHDSVSQSLYSLNLFAEAGQRMLQNRDVDRAEKYLERINDTAQEALREMRQLLFELRPLDLESGKLAELIQQRLEIVERRSGITAHFITSAMPPLSRKLEENIYYIVIEALNNALKHSKCDAISITISAAGERLTVEIADNGIGLDQEQTQQHSGMGLANMSDRAHEISGVLNIQPRSGERGTVVRLSIPLGTPLNHD